MSPGRHTARALSPSTQVRHPWRASARTGLAAALAALIAFPEVARVLDVDDLPVVATVVAIATLVTRVLAIPSVDAWLHRYLPWLSSTPPPDREETPQ